MRKESIEAKASHLGAFDRSLADYVVRIVPVPRVEVRLCFLLLAGEVLESSQNLDMTGSVHDGIAFAVVQRLLIRESVFLQLLHDRRRIVFCLALELEKLSHIRLAGMGGYLCGCCLEDLAGIDARRNGCRVLKYVK